MDFKEKIQTRIQELEQARLEFIKEVEQNIAGFNAALNELKKLIAEPTSEE